MRNIFVAIVMAMLVQSNAVADIIDFERLGLNPGDVIPQSLGDSSAVDVSFGSTPWNSPDGDVSGSLIFADTGYGDLSNFIHWPGFDGGGFIAGTVVLFGSDNHEVTLESFDAALVGDLTESVSVRIFDGQENLLYEQLNVGIDVGTHVTFEPNVTADHLILKWTGIDSTRNQGVDNIQFSVNQIPEPSGIGFVFLASAGCALRRRRTIR